MTQLLNPGRSSGASKRTELAALNEIIRKLIRLSSSFTDGVGTATLAEQQTQTTALNSINSNTLSLLNNLVASQDIEILLVRDTGAADVVVQQIREYDQGTGTWSTRYEDVNGTAYVVVGPLVYLDPSAMLNLILTQLQVLNAGGQLLTEATFTAEDFATEVTLSGIKTQTDLLNFIATALEVNVTSAVLPTGASTETKQDASISSLSSIITELQLLIIELAKKADLTETQPVSLATVPLPTGAATQATLAALLTELQLKADLSETQPVSLVQSNLHKLQTEANDLVETYTYLDPGNPTDRRISTIVYSSVLLALSVTETFAYAGGAGDYYVTSSTLS